MKGGCFPLLLYAALLLCLIPTSSLKRLHFGHCAVSVDMYEIRKGFGDIKEMTQSQDQYTSIQLLHRSYSLQNTKFEDRCCFFHYLLEFYLGNVFNQCGEGSNFYQRRISRIANNFLSIKKELGLCDPVMMCPCRMEANHSHKQILTQFQRANGYKQVKHAMEIWKTYSTINPNHVYLQPDPNHHSTTGVAQMDSHSAALKALGELDILLDWIDRTE